MQAIHLLRLLSHILCEGKFKHSGYDFSIERREALRRFQPFLPDLPVVPSLTERVRHPIVRTLYAEASYVKSCMRPRGNHITLAGSSVSYVRIPRAASTTIIRQIILSHFPGLAGVALTATDVNHLAGIHTKQRLTSGDRDHQFFTVVRNPFARIVSVYRTFFQNANKSFLYEDYLFGIFRQRMSFREFVRALEIVPDWLKDQHLKPQHLMLRYYERMGINVKVLKLECATETKQFLTNIGIGFEVFNPSHESYDYRAYYDADLVRMVGRIYEDDLFRFGYDAYPEF